MARAIILNIIMGNIIIMMSRSQDKEEKEGDREMNAYKVPFHPKSLFSPSCLFLSLSYQQMLSQHLLRRLKNRQMFICRFTTRCSSLEGSGPRSTS